MAKHLDVGTFPEKRQGEIEKVLQECGRRFADTQFDSNGQGWEIISEREVLEEATRPFIALSPTTRAHKLIAWRFSTAIILPIPKEVIVDLIPVALIGTPSVGGRNLEIGKLIRVDKNVEVKPVFTCLARIYR